MEHSRKAFHFDLDEKKLKASYPSDSATGYRRAWSDKNKGDDIRHG